MRVTDDGAGIGPAIASKGKDGRFGLPGMRERAATIGAELAVLTSPSGTSITVIVPGRIAFRRGRHHPPADAVHATSRRK